MHKKILPILLSSILLVECTTTTTPTTIQETSETIEETTITSETSQETSIETTQETTIETTQFQTSLPYMRTINFDGKHIPDGYYQFRPWTISKDGLKCIADIYGFYYLEERDLDYIKNFDSIYLGEEKFPITINEYNDIYVNNYLYILAKRQNGIYILNDFDTNQYCATYQIAENFNIKIDKNVYIFDSLYTYPYWDISEDEHQNYLNGYLINNEPILYENEAVQKYLDKYPEATEFGMSCKYRTIEDFIYAYNELSLGVGTPIVIYVENQTIKEMYLNPGMHQPWRVVNADIKNQWPYNTQQSNDKYKIKIID